MPTDVRPPNGVPAVAVVGREAVPGAARADRLGAGARLLDAVTDLRRDVVLTSFPLPLPGVAEASARRQELLDQLDDHLLPRLRELSAPAVVVVAGSTGAGKSTLVNSLLGAEVSPAGVLRPTTRRPVLAHHPADGPLLAEHPLLEIVDVVVADVVPRGIALVDAPDLDSLLASNRATAHRLLEAADLWLFLTTAARYGDAVPWTVLEQAATRGTSMAMVLNRVPAAALATVRGDLLGRLRERGMAAVPLFLVPDAGPQQGLLDARTVAPVLRWLTMVAGSDRARSVIERTQRGTVRALRPWVEELADAVQAQVDARTQLEAVVQAAVEGPAERAGHAVLAGAVAEGPVRARWGALAGPGGPLHGRWSRRGSRARRAGLGVLDQDLLLSATVVLLAARRYGGTAVVDALSGADAPGAAGVLTALAPDDMRGGHGDDGLHGAEDDARRSAREWRDGVLPVLRSVAAERPEARAAAERLLQDLGDDGAATLVACAAGGVDGAALVLTRALGAGVAAAVTAAVASDLATRARTQALRGGDPALAVLAAPDLADDAASRLRLRLAVLKGLT